MSNEITPFDGYGADADLHAQQGALARPLAPQSMGQEPMNGNGAAAPPPGGMAKRIHNSLRGRYWLAIVLGVICGGFGGYFGFRSQQPIYRAEAAFRIRQTIKSVGVPYSTDSPSLSNFDELLQSEALTITSQRILKEAVKNQFWKQTGLTDDLRMLAPLFAKNLSAEHPSRTEFVRIYYTDADKEVAQSVVQAITHAYEDHARSRSQGDENTRLDALDKRRSMLAGQIARFDQQILDAAKIHGSPNLEALHENKLQEVQKIESKLNEAELALEAAKRKKNAKEAIIDLNEHQIAMIDPIMRNHVMNREHCQSRIEQLKGRVGEQHTDMKEAKAQLARAENNIARYMADWKDLQMRLPDEPNLGASGIPRLLSLSPAIIQAEVDTLKAKHKQLEEERVAIGRKSLEIQDLQRRREEVTKDHGDITRRMEAIRLEIMVGDRLQIVSYGDVSNAPFKDRRKMFGAAGALGGFGIPVALLVFLGLMDKRYRYSDEANDGVSNVPLLGILPRLPDKLTDPEQAAVAAHCIHQIRIMLQVGGDPERRRVFMITSASTGDGKTSLTMALGLSFAASGSKTLVIDCDMVGQGLTHRLKAHDVPGLIETLNLGTLRGHVRKTATKGLYVLPIGNADAVHAGVLSPQSINRLLTACREHFDVIVIDTGPILGSLEASVVAAEADGVIVAVARGQQQPLVEKAIKHLRGIGATIFGIVFNRAEQRDFQRSVASASIRSISARPTEPRGLLPESAESSRFGPLASSVASSLPDEGNRGHNGHNG